MTNDVVVTQVDRDRAASLAPPGSELADMRRSGRHDGLPDVQAFARHRIEALAAREVGREAVKTAWATVKLEIGHLFQDGRMGYYAEVRELDAAIATLRPAIPADERESKVRIAVWNACRKQGLGDSPIYVIIEDILAALGDPA